MIVLQDQLISALLSHPDTTPYFPDCSHCLRPDTASALQSALLVLCRMAADELRRSQLATAFWFCDCDKENNFCHQELLFFPPIWSSRALKNMEAMTEYRTTPHRAPANQNSVPIAFGHRPSAAAQLIECLKENEWQKRERNPDFVYKTLC
jgi:hypothetical protein